MQPIFTSRLKVILLILSVAYQAAAQEFSLTPEKEKYLRDDAGLCDREQRQEIINLLEKHNQNHLGRIYLDILKKLPEGKTVQQYAYSRLNERPRSSGEKADKIMLVVVLDNKMLRIETSRDVQSILTDEECHKINNEVIIPYFKRGEYYRGIRVGIITIMKKLKGG